MSIPLFIEQENVHIVIAYTHQLVFDLKDGITKVKDKYQGNNSRYINLGDWLNYNSYADFDGQTTTLKYYGK